MCTSENLSASKLKKSKAYGFLVEINAKGAFIIYLEGGL